MLIYTFQRVETAVQKTKASEAEASTSKSIKDTRTGKDVKAKDTESGAKPTTSQPVPPSPKPRTSKPPPKQEEVLKIHTGVISIQSLQSWL